MEVGGDVDGVRRKMVIGTEIDFDCGRDVGGDIETCMGLDEVGWLGEMDSKGSLIVVVVGMGGTEPFNIVTSGREPLR